MEKMQFVCPKCGCHEFVQISSRQLAAPWQNCLIFKIKNSLPSAVKNADIQKFIGRKHPQVQIFWTSSLEAENCVRRIRTAWVQNHTVLIFVQKIKADIGKITKKWKRKGKKVIVSLFFTK